MKTRKKLYIIVGTVLGAGALVAGWCFVHKPVEVKRPCPITYTRAVGLPKKTFNKAWKANLQSVKQLLQYGELCNPYKANGKYYTDHRKTGIIHSLKIA